MFDRKELKALAKESFKANYWKSVLVFVILAVIGGGASVAGSRVGATADYHAIAAAPRDAMLMLGFLLALLGLVAVALLFTALAGIFLLNPLQVGCLHFARNNADAPASLDDLGAGFTNYWPTVKTMFFYGLYIFLWSLLFVIPGVVKSYSYRMVPYLIADHPELSTREILDLSRSMMRGNKWEAFVLDLSFLGWNILTGLTFGLVGIFYAGPYQMQTNANLYLALCRNDQNTL